MGRKYATGRYAKLICDVCSWKLDYKDAVTDWQGFRMHKTPCYEERHPQTWPVKRIDDPQALIKPRTDIVSPTVAHPGSDVPVIYPDTSGGWPITAQYASFDAVLVSG